MAGSRTAAVGLRRWKERQTDSADCTHRTAYAARRVQSGSGFHEHCNTDEKQRQRDAVTVHLAAYINSLGNSFSPFVCSLPGERWIVEHSLLDQVKSTKLEFVGFEKCPVTYQRSLPYIPRAKYRHNRVHSVSLDRHADIQAVTSGGRAKLILGDISACLSYTGTEEQPDTAGFFKDKPSNRIVRSYHGFWLDTFSPLGSDTGWACAKILAKLASTRFGAAFAFAFVLGRDIAPYTQLINASTAATPLARRVDAVRLLIEQFGRKCAIADVLTHDSWNDNSTLKIVTILGSVLPRENHSVNDHAHG